LVKLDLAGDYFLVFFFRKIADDCASLFSRYRDITVTIMSKVDILPQSLPETRRSMKFESMPQANVPKGRDGKHKNIVELLLNDISQLKRSSALKIPISALPDTKENVRAALSRASRQKGIDIATSSDNEFLYVWKTEQSIES
jgi:hypothetical protein